MVGVVRIRWTYLTLAGETRRFLLLPTTVQTTPLLNLVDLNKYFCHWRPAQSATMVDYDIPRYWESTPGGEAPLAIWGIGPREMQQQQARSICMGKDSAICGDVLRTATSWKVGSQTCH